MQFSGWEKGGMKTPEPKVAGYVAVSAAAAFVVAALCIYRFPPTTSAAIGFALLSFIVAQFPLMLPNGALFDISFVIMIAAVVSDGPSAALIATVASAVSFKTARSRSLMRHTFNVAQLAVSAGIAGLVYVRLGGPVGTPADGIFPQILLPLAAATATIYVCNIGLVCGAIGVAEGRSPLNVWRDGYLGIGRNFVAFALLGLLLGVLKNEIGWPSVLFLLMPLLVARQAFQGAVSMQKAFDATVASLIKAIEAKDPYTRGHAQRVSRLSEMTARAYGLNETECRAIRYAALMHDVGKLGVDSRVLKKPGKLTSEEYEHMKVHPARGVEIVGHIDMLRDYMDGVRHHHERMDGSGYPDGLIGDEIPLFARLIMVSDAFDAMTSTRVYRKAKDIEAAFIELRRCAGTQFDVKALEALERAVAEHGWEPAPEEDDEEMENADAVMAGL
jgi:HD-GYP domain-containing protein (c-di-GMP phosphodiesterase class II)